MLVAQYVGAVAVAYFPCLLLVVVVDDRKDHDEKAHHRHELQRKG